MLKTEMCNELSKNIDRASTKEILEIIQSENINAAIAVGNAIDSIEKACDAISEGMKYGGHLYYIGAGTSGRLGVLDASECPPTFGVTPDTVVGIIAGGDKCLRSAAENAEDKGENGIKDISNFNQWFVGSDFSAKGSCKETSKLFAVYHIRLLLGDDTISSKSVNLRFNTTQL